MAVEVVAVMVPAAAIPTIHMAERDGSVDWHMPGEDLGPRIEATIPYARWGPEGADPPRRAISPRGSCAPSRP